MSTGLWVGDCFVFSNASWRLNYCVGGEVTVMFHLDRPLFLLGYIAAQQRIYLIDREHSIVSYTLLLALVEFKTLVMRGETDDAYDMIPSLPEDQLDGCACAGALHLREQLNQSTLRAFRAFAWSHTPSSKPRSHGGLPPTRASSTAARGMGSTAAFSTMHDQLCKLAAA